ncbi:tyrosine-type recombinase/integrase [Desulfobacterales bacterium HSG17]|nr:tyrosine-type recombinase/integrase [Desulfobacterales bacterium HSG17]
MRFNDLRHTFASLLLEQGENIKYIQTQLGHSSPTVTLNVYAHLMNPTNQKAACRLEKLIFENNGSRKQKKGYSLNRNPLIFIIGTIGFEPTTPTVSG